MSETSIPKLALIGLAAGVGSGLFGVGGGVIMVPLLVLTCGFEQHRAHVNSLAAGILLGASGAITYGLDGSLDVPLAVFLALGAIVGAPIGARVMARTPGPRLTMAFGVLLLVVAALLVVT